MAPVKQDAERDARELAWWREVFACRFRRGNLPRVDTALFGRRFVLMEEDEHGDLHEVKA